ncbi:MAG: tetratricopeptide repeat protein [Phycisphaerae bacterium]|nr:tetratricopeptide repeat protein [Phycisphaerae bacterium]MDW8261880.1 tetratricopeptide repeat protein [Phycisphaerales bacterium]
MNSSEAKRALAVAMAHHQAGRLAEAESLYRAVVQRQPRNPDALHFLGVLLHQTNRPQEALEPMARSLELSPSAPHFHANYAELLRTLGRFDDALHHARTAVRLGPTDPDAHHSLGMALRTRGDVDGALKAFATAIRLRPNHVAALDEYGLLLQKRGQLNEAIALFRRAAAAAPGRLTPLLNLGNALQLLGELDESIATFERVLEIDPANAGARNNIAQSLLEKGLHQEALVEYSRALELEPHGHVIGSNRIMALNYADGVSIDELFAAHVDWARRFAPTDAQPRGSTNARIDPSRRLRVGYLSPDFRFHSVTQFLLPLLRNHDPSAVEVFAYSDVSVPDAMTTQLQGLVHVWRDISPLRDSEAADLIRSDQIDVLVDLAGHTSGNRLPMFASRPAPIQVTYLGWQNTTGLRSIDARLTDSVIDPIGQTDQYHTERLLRLDGAFAVFEPTPGFGEMTPLPASKTGHLTFGSVAKVAKITDRMLRVWGRVLRAVPGSRLMLIATAVRTASVRDRLLQILCNSGVTSDRIVLLPDMPYAEYMRLYSQIDLVLDTSPFNGHTTTCQGLWMGVPTLTLAGHRYASRMGLAVMTHLGLAADFVAFSEEEFLAKAVALSGRVEELAALRQGLRDRLLASPLMDGKRLARSVESAYRNLAAGRCPVGT